MKIESNLQEKAQFINMENFISNSLIMISVKKTISKNLSKNTFDASSWKNKMISSLSEEKSECSVNFWKISFKITI